MGVMICGERYRKIWNPEYVGYILNIYNFNFISLYGAICYSRLFPPRVSAEATVATVATVARDKLPLKQYVRKSDVICTVYVKVLFWMWHIWAEHELIHINDQNTAWLSQTPPRETHFLLRVSQQSHVSALHVCVCIYTCVYIYIHIHENGVWLLIQRSCIRRHFV